MNDFPLASLEGLIHNIRTPLNLILGYSQQMQRIDSSPKVEEYNKRIYKAGIQIENLLQGIWDALELRESTQKETNLNKWLLGELALLQCDLKIKHRILFTTILTEQEDTNAKITPKTISLWFEAVVMGLLRLYPDKSLNLRIVVTAEPTLQIFILNKNLNHSLIPELLSEAGSIEGANACMQVSLNPTDSEGDSIGAEGWIIVAQLS